jgi:uncharacterized protein
MISTATQSASELAKAMLEQSPRRVLLLADWDRALFVHFKIDARILQPFVPFELDLWDGAAYVSLVAFTQRRLRPRWGGRVSEFLAAPLASHEFLNLRTYVTHGGERAIYFLSEWIPNRLAVMLGPITYGLPYHFGRLRYRHEHENDRIEGEVSQGRATWRYRASLNRPHFFAPVESDSLDEFLLERYIAFTKQGETSRRFRIWHEPWPQTTAEATILEDSLPASFVSWFEAGEYSGAHYSPGAKDVWIGGPERV